MVEDREDSSPEEFEKALESYDAVLVNFFAPWCPHCVQFAPVWRAAKEALDGYEFADNVALIEVDCNVHRTFCETRQSIDRFPTVRAYANGGTDVEMYTGDLSMRSLVSYVQSLMSTRSQHLQPAQGLEYQVNDTVQVGWHAGWRDATIRKCEREGHQPC